MTARVPPVTTSSAEPRTRTFVRPTRWQSRGVVLPIAMVLLGVLLTFVAIRRLDSVLERTPGVWSSEQLLPVDQGLLDEILGTPAAAKVLEQQGRTELTTLLAPSASNVAVTSWSTNGHAVVVVATARVSDPAAFARSLDHGPPYGSLQTFRAWTVGDRFVAVLGVKTLNADEANNFADRVSRHVKAGVRLGRVVWFLAFALAPAVAILVLLNLARFMARLVFAVGFGVFVVAFGLGVIVYLLVMLPLAILSRGRFGWTRPPRWRPAPRLSATLAPHVTEVDLEEATQTVTTKRRIFGIAVVLTTVALLAYVAVWWPGSSAWVAAVAVILLLLAGLRAKVGVWVLLALVVVLAAAIADEVFASGPGNPMRFAPFVWGVVALAVVTLMFFWRNVVSASRRLSYEGEWSDLNPRAIAYLIGGASLALPAICLFLGSNGDPDIGSQIISKALAALGLVAVPVVVRRLRAAQDAGRRMRARDSGLPEVLFLRSFVDDGLRVRSRMGDRSGLEPLVISRSELFEDVLVRAFEALGPVVAIAKPGTKQPELGAARDSIVVDDWLTVVKTEMKDSAYIVAILGSGEGLRRELVTLQDLDLLGRVCLVVPPIRSDDASVRLKAGTSAIADRMGWGTLESDLLKSPEWSDSQSRRRQRRHQRDVVALVGDGAGRLLVTCAKRNSAGTYLRLGQWLTELRRAQQAHEPGG